MSRNRTHRDQRHWPQVQLPGSGFHIVKKRPPPPDHPWAERFSIGAIRELPGWSVSLAIHVVLFLLLAIWTLGDQIDDRRIVLEISSMGEDIQTREVELETGGGSKSETKAEADSESMSETDDEEVEVPIDPADIENADLAANDDFSESGSSDLDGNEQADGSMNTGQSQGAGEGAGMEFFGAKTSGSRFIFVLDCSGSMNTDNRWDRACSELLASIEGMTEEQEFLVMLYHSDSVPMLRMKTATADLVLASDENKRKFNEWLEMQSPVGRTRPAASIRRALSLAPDAIFFLSDGEFKDDTMEVVLDCNIARERTDGKRRRTSIHTFFLGTDAKSTSMKTIAEQNNGIFTAIE